MMQPTVQNHLTRSPNDNLQQLFSTNSNFKKFTRRHSEKIKENNYSNNARNCNNTSNAKNASTNRRTLLPLVLPNQTDPDQIILLNNNTTAATQSLFNLTKFEPANLDQIKLIFKDIESLKMPRKFLSNNKNDNNISSCAKSKIESLDVDNDKLLSSQTSITNASNNQTSTLISAQAKEPLIKFKKNSKCKKQIKKAKLNSDGDTSITSSNSSSLAPNANAPTSITTSTTSTSTTTKIATPTASIRSASSSSSLLFSSSSSPSSLSSPSAVSSHSQPFFVTSDHCQQQHQHTQQNLKQRHAHRHRNFKCQNFDSGESVNDPDSISVPSSLILANKNNSKNITKRNDDDNDEEEDDNDDADETAPCLNQKTSKIRNEQSKYLQLDDILDKNESSSDNINSIDRHLCLINNDKAKIVEEEEIDETELSTNDNITIPNYKTHNNRSSPNLMEIQNEEEPLLSTEKPNNNSTAKNNKNIAHNADSKCVFNSNITTQTKSKIFNNTKIATHSPNTESSSNMFNSILINNAFNNCFTNLIVNKKFTQRYKLLTEGDLQVCKLQHSRNVLSKLLNSKLLRRWKAHRIILTDTEIYSTTKTDYMDSSIPYHTITEISPISKWEPGQKYCLRIATTECQYLLQTNNIYVRDQWIHSILWKKHKFKSERVLRNAVRPEVLIREIKNMIDMSTTTPIDDTEISQHPLELVSEILQKHKLPKQTHEEVIVALSPLLEKNHPSPEICDFFSRHCRDSPRSHIVIEMFSPVVQRILKHNGDFGRYPRMRLFVQDYLMALVSQNVGLQTVQNFVISMHSTSSQCPFPRVLPNFVSVCLASIHGCFETHKSSQPIVQLSPQEQEDQLVCHTTMMYTMSTFEDWRTNLAQLLQSVPFPDQALTHEKFIKIFKNVVKNFAQDSRCEVHQTLLGIREGKEGWFEIFCPGGISCDDDGELFAIMLQTLIGCCCKKKRFLLSINKMLSHIMVLAIREVPCAIETLCAMLDLDGVENVDNKLKIISTLQSTELGLKYYAKVCERQMQLKELQSKGGPRKLTLPSRSTDEDLAKLLLSGSFGNLECLSLAFTNVTSACAEYLIKLPSLRYLNLWSTKFGDQGLELISEHLQRLQVLNLCETPVTDKGLACLASMKQLRKLNLNSTNLSALTFEGLKECLPALQECDIRYTDAW